MHPQGDHASTLPSPQGQQAHGRTMEAPPPTPPQAVESPSPEIGEEVPLAQVPSACPPTMPASQRVPFVPPAEAQVHDDGRGELSMAPHAQKRGPAEALGDDGTKGGRTSPVAPLNNADDDNDGDEGGEEERESGDE